MTCFKRGNLKKKKKNKTTKEKKNPKNNTECNVFRLRVYDKDFTTY